MTHPLHLTRVHAIDRRQQTVHLGIFSERVTRRDSAEGKDPLDDCGRRAVLVDVYQLMANHWVRAVVRAGFHVRGDLGVVDQVGQIETYNYEGCQR